MSLRRSFYLVLLAAAVIRICVALPSLTNSSLATYGDSDAYLRLATNLAEGRGYSHDPVPPYLPDLFRTPLYPAFLAGIWNMLGTRAISPILVAQLLLDLVTCALVMLIAERLHRRTSSTDRGDSGKGALMAGAWYAMSMVSVAYASTVASETLFTVLTTALVAVLVVSAGVVRRTASELNDGRGKPVGPLPKDGDGATARRSWSNPLTFSIAAGCLWGLATLARPIALPLAPLVAIAGAFAAPRRRLLSGMLAALAGFAIIGPWLVRNHEVCERWTIASVAEHNLLAYNAAGVEADRLGISVEEAREGLLQEVRMAASGPIAEVPPGELIDLYREHGQRVLLRHPMRTVTAHVRSDLSSLLPAVPELFQVMGVRTATRGTLSVLNDRGLVAAGRHYFEGKGSLALLILPWALIWVSMLALAMWGILLYWKRREWFALFVIGGFAAFFLLVPGAPSNPRFAAPAAPLLAVAAGGGFVDAIARFEQTRKRRHESHDRAGSSSTPFRRP